MLEAAEHGDTHDHEKFHHTHDPWKLKDMLYEVEDESEHGFVDCDYCGGDIFPWQDAIEGEYYDTPFEDEPTTYLAHYHDDSNNDCCYYKMEYDPSYFDCVECERHICSDNGRMKYYRNAIDDDDDTEEPFGLVCLRCYKTRLMEEGQPRRDFEGDTISGGMFFNRGNPGPLAAGFYEYRTSFIKGPAQATPYNEEALRLVDEGFHVITGYEMLGLGGSEGTITMMIRDPQEGIDE